jgi:hypothetical protein
VQDSAHLDRADRDHCRIGGLDRGGVLDQVTELGVSRVTDRAVERYRLPGDPLELVDPGDADPERRGQLRVGGFAAEVRQQRRAVRAEG